MAVRDRVVLTALGCGVLLTLLAWHLAGLWGALVVAVVALAAAAVVYRIEAPRIDVEHPEAWDVRDAPEHPAGTRPERIDR